MTPEFMTDWILSVIFWLAVILFLFGLGLMLMPERMMAWGRSLNRSIETHGFFRSVDGPRYYESVIYRHHRVAGTLIILFAAVTIYMFAFYTGMDTVRGGIAVLANNHPFYTWLLETLYYVLLGLNVIALVIGAIVLIRPSLLKRVEAWGNRWVDTQSRLETLDREHEIPENILPGRPRWFGFFVCAGAAYMMYNTASSVF